MAITVIDAGANRRSCKHSSAPRSAGYTNVTELKKDAQSVWHGRAMKGGTSVRVALDYQGTIVAN